MEVGAIVGTEVGDTEDESSNIDDDEEFGGFEDDDINPPPLPARPNEGDAQSLGGFFDENVTDEEYEEDIYEDVDGLEDGEDDGALQLDPEDDAAAPELPAKPVDWGFGD